MQRVTLEQLRSRFAYVEARRLEYERQSAPSVKHEVWRHTYLCDPYLIGAPSDRLAKRWTDVFINVTELQPNAKLGVHDFKSDDSLSQKFTHLLEEYGLRGGPPVDVVQNGRKPLLRYFENGDPIANRIFDGYTKPTTPIIVKYGKREHLEPMLREGRIRVCPASYYADPSHNAAIQDDELTRSFFIPSYRDRLKGTQHIEFDLTRIQITDDDIIARLPLQDYFLYCLCDHIYYRMPTDFDADSALIIREPDRFAQRLISHFLAANPDWEPLYGPVTYYDPYRDYKKMKVPEMSKHFGYSYQREVRIAFRPRRPAREKLVHQNFKIGPMSDYAELLTA